MTIVLLGLVAILTSILSAVVGMIGGTVLLSIMTFFLAWQAVIPIHGAVQLASNGSRSFLLFKSIHRKIFTYYAIGAPLGAFVSAYFLIEITDPRLSFSLVVALIVYTLFKPKKLPALKIPYPAFMVLGFAIGFLGLLVGAVGPMMAPFFYRDDLKKEEIIATQATCQTLTHVLKLPAFMYIGFNYGEYSTLIIVMVIGSFVGSKIGVHALSKVDEKVFRWIYRIALGVAGIRLIYLIATFQN